ncbi:MAG: response regulator transcription factor [Pseudomonadota bacterium]|jgi:DNA-binding NarL/FixJ family response regulator|nr:DNA-binding response regulator [Pseudomonadota bacterium]QKK06400.1 MAG: response regulator transcription factor [Pseudomonadota bacterium]|tara:strand:- start:2199 stop:2831 length:633 start_codon:yes stop_codon:yes gene_type:complete
MDILLADDHAMFRSGLRHILEEEFPEAVIEEAESCAEVLKKNSKQDWNIIILDVAMGDKNSLNILPRLKEKKAAAPILILSMYNDRQFVLQALRGGADGYLTKEHAPEELIKAVHTILSGKKYITPLMTESLADYLSSGQEGETVPHARLSAREHEVFLMIAAGVAMTEIADRLAISVKTVSTYRTRILEKMDMNSNADLIRYAVQNGLA